MLQVQVVVMELLELYLRYVAVAQHPEHVIKKHIAIVILVRVVHMHQVLVVIMERRVVVMDVVEQEHVVRLVRIMVEVVVVVARHLLVEVVILKNQVVKTVPVQQGILVNAILVQIHVHNMCQILHVL